MVVQKSVTLRTIARVRELMAGNRQLWTINAIAKSLVLNNDAARMAIDELQRQGVVEFVPACTYGDLFRMVEVLENGSKNPGNIREASAEMDLEGVNQK